MSKFYSEKHRALQDKFDSRRMADLMENNIVHNEFAEHESAFIQSLDMFFLSTVDGAGRPTVSYKGGAPGFVRVTGPSALVFPWYDGNGMYYSAGNLMNAAQVGLLFIDFVTPNRLRVQGEAEVRFEHPLLDLYPGAEFLVNVAVEAIWVNCPRYIHRHEKVGLSKYVPQPETLAPLPGWKRLDIVQDAIPARDRERVAGAGGELSMESYAELIAKGEA
ncbi:pyridoxamine 5'-phosphate oxidase family protein [Rhodoblastus acidophilus]|uniref:Pyridoxamine 5'-phosphate oxidase family protein n=1 Tax=Candidatus Rhodoblastus alkanivorans TaxID=2954117 RepID=A0ABS9Z964_9HYPH|nr:pyridoxamine 5'-phosphate oxidase family protein [Candidatus Rhodoblastus alkanivorans]MCI4678338.1 pyridoxamine 5'-phosphate oxidase family protein [Candidatus Rhodoblastus alkanivorans]MCI4683596.1 pyridoxamine 5'-phosphate oxidase family protein [Candidatus Rhodoblastus alkanivorans]MDI4640912.1 pyridoxamine 5'-phosphate oxidase family protein [Rhodoblastus acidophilus]